MKTKLKDAALAVAIVCGIPCVAYAGWRFDRWLNWNYDYSDRVVFRIENLEYRIYQLEKAQKRLMKPEKDQ